jgi:N4-gp56 family major capsid protein
MRRGNYFTAIIHPDVAYDLTGETGAAAWRDPHTYSQPAEIWAGEVGAFEGFRFLETSRAYSLADAGAGGTVDVYATIFMGREGLAKGTSTGGGYGRNPVVVISPITDHLMRFRGVGWKHFVGYGVFRQEAIRRVESASSIATNV